MGNTTCRSFKNAQDKQERQEKIDSIIKSAQNNKVSENAFEILQPIFNKYIEYGEIPTITNK